MKRRRYQFANSAVFQLWWQSFIWSVVLLLLLTQATFLKQKYDCIHSLQWCFPQQCVFSGKGVWLFVQLKAHSHSPPQSADSAVDCVNAEIGIFLALRSNATRLPQTHAENAVMWVSLKCVINAFHNLIVFNLILLMSYFGIMLNL